MSNTFTLRTECFLCWRVINSHNSEKKNLENKTDRDKSCYNFNDNQIVNCKKYLKNEILNECKKQDKVRSSWDSQLFCFNCFEMSESLTAVHEVFLEVQQQLLDIVELFNREIVKERLAKQSTTVDCNSKCISGDNFIPNAMENEKPQSRTKSFQGPLNKKNVQQRHKKEHFPPNCSNPKNEMKKTTVLNSGDLHKKKIMQTILDENNLFLTTSTTVDHYFEIKDEPVSFNECPLLQDCTNKNVSHLNNSGRGADNIESVDRNCSPATLPGMKVLVIELTKLQLGPDGKVLLTESTPITGGKMKRKAAIRAVELFKANKDINTTKDKEGSCSDIDIQSENTDFESGCENVIDDEDCEESIEIAKTKKKPSTQSSLKKKKLKEKILSLSHSCEKCGKMFRFKRSVLLHQMRYKECEQTLKKYFCKICNCTIPRGTRTTHNRIHTLPYSCHECGVSFNRPDTFRRHMKKKHIKEFNFPCDRCDEKFKVIQDLNAHKRQHKKEDFMSNCDRGEHYQCNICKESFQKTNDLNLELFLTHMFSHGIYKCDHCNEKFDTKESLKDHYSSEKHIGGFTCDLCPLVSPSIIAWKGHKRRHLNKNKRHVCEHCGLSYKDVTLLKYHIIENHMENAEKNFKCDQEGCDRAYITKRQLMGHVITTHKEKICEVCGLKVRHMSHHMETHNQIPYECDVCGKKFKKKSNLNVHKRVLHEGHVVVCKICRQNCSSKKNLRSHMLKHDDKRPFKCSECDKCFYRSDNLTTHLRSHTGEKPYKCDNCGKQFTRKDNLNTHVKKCPNRNKTSDAS